MNIDLDIIFASIIALLMLGVTLLIADVRDLKTQTKVSQAQIEELNVRVSELTIVVNQKFLPAMILDKQHLEVR
jgi:hypothetical protein